MAFTSFTVRNTVSDKGSALRRTNVTQDSSTPNGSGTVVSDSGLRADGFFLPIPEQFLESTFEANVYDRDSVELNWTFGFTLVSLPTATEPVEVLIRASSYGEPITAGDGDFVFSITADNFALAYSDNNSIYIKEGNWIYYSMFVRYEDSVGDGFYERVATLSVQIPRDFGSTADLWKRIPNYYKELDSRQTRLRSGLTPLYAFVDLFGWELDKIRTTIYDTMRINDPDVIHSSAINALADQNGVEITREALGTSKLRALLTNIGYLRRTKGTVNSINSYISALSGCNVRTMNAFNDPGPAEFYINPMRVNFVTDPFFKQPSTGPTSPDTGTTQRVWAAYTAGSRAHGWGVLGQFSSDPATDMAVSTTGEKLTVTLPALSGTVSLLIYGRGWIPYHNTVTYYFSAQTSHTFTPRFLLGSYISSGFPGYLEGTTPPTGVTYFDDWNNSTTNFPVFKDTLTNNTRNIVASIPSNPVYYPYTYAPSVIPVFKFDITLSPTSTTTVTFEKPLVEPKKSSGAFFSGNEPLGGFIQDPIDSIGAGSYDYHWGKNGGSGPHTDFSYYTLDFHRVKSVVDYVIEDYIMPVNIVKTTDYVLYWDAIEFM